MAGRSTAATEQKPRCRILRRGFGCPDLHHDPTFWTESEREWIKAGQATRAPDMPEYDIKDIDKGFDNYVADTKSLMCPETCAAGAREAVRSDGVVIRLDSQGRAGMRNEKTITTYFRPDDPDTYFAREAAR